MKLFPCFISAVASDPSSISVQYPAGFFPINPLHAKQSRGPWIAGRTTDSYSYVLCCRCCAFPFTNDKQPEQPWSRVSAGRVQVKLPRFYRVPFLQRSNPCILIKIKGCRKQDHISN